GPASRRRRRTVHGGAALWRVVLGPRRPHDRRRIARSVRVFRRHHPGGPCCRDLADNRAAHRVGTRRTRVERTAIALVVVRTARRRLQLREPKEARYGVRSEREWNATYH